MYWFASGPTMRRVSAETFTTVFRNAPVAMLLLGINREIRGMNRAAEEMFVGSADELTGVALGNAIHCIHYQLKW